MKELNKLEELMAEMHSKDNFAREAGSAAAALIVEKVGSDRTDLIAKAMAQALIDLEKDACDYSCARLGQEWMMDYYLGAKIKERIPLFEKLHTKLTELGATFEDRLEYGDLDGGIWAMVDENGVKIIANECHCSCADANIHVYLNDSFDFHARECSKDGANGTMKYSEGIKIHRKRCYDTTDKGICFVYSKLQQQVSQGLFSFYPISRALDGLESIRDAIAQPYRLPGE